MTATPLNTQLIFEPGDRVRLTAAFDGDATDVSWNWVPPAGSNAPASSTNTLEWDTVDGDEGVYNVEVTSPTASDSPAYGAIRLDKAAPPVEPDPDALAYIAAVEAADGQALEASVKTAIDTFVKALKATTGWAAMTNFYPMVGARTLAGALVPLRGVAATFQNLTSGDYNRKTGITGDYTGKGGELYLLRYRNNHHLSMYYSGDVFWGAGLVGSFINNGGGSFSGENGPGILFNDPLVFYNYGEGDATGRLDNYQGGFIGVARNGPAAAQYWYTSVESFTTFPSTLTGEAPANTKLGIMCRWNWGLGLEFFMSGTCCCFSHGYYYTQPMQVRAAINQYLADLAAALP